MLDIGLLNKQVCSSMANDDLIGTKAVAELLGKSVPTINRMAARGELPVAAQLPAEEGRGARLYRRSDIEALIEVAS